MVERIGNFLNSNIRGLHMAAYVMASFTIASSMLALIRDRLLASTFGAGIELDIYYASFRIPDLLFVSIGSLVSVSVLIPLLAKKNQDADAGEQQKEISQATTFFVCLISVSAVIVYLLMPLIISSVFSGFDEENIRSVITLSRWLLISPIVLGCSNLFGAVTQLQNRFVLYAVSPLLYNIGIICGILFFAPAFGIQGVVYGVLLGALLHVCPQAVYVYKVKLWPTLTKLSWQYVKSMASVSASRTIALSFTHMVLLLLVAIASSLMTGTISVFIFSYNLQAVLVSVVGVSYSVAAFSSLSKCVAREAWGEFTKELTSSFRQLLFWAIPAAVLLIILRAQIVRTVLGGGLFGWEETRLTAASLAIFAVATVFQSASLLFTRAYYAQGETIKPLVAHMVGSVLSVGLGIVSFHVTPEYYVETLSVFLHVSDLDSRVLLLPSVFAIGSGVTALVLFVPLCMKKLILVSKRFVIEVVSGSFIMGGAAYGGLILFEPLAGDTLVGIFTQGLLAGLCGILVGIGFLWVVGNADIRDALYFIVPKKEKFPLPVSDITEINS